MNLPLRLNGAQVHCTNAEGGSRAQQNQAIATDFSRISAAFCLESLYIAACRQGLVPAYCCSAVSRSSIAKPPPFLGVSSLNLAALTSGHFFCLGLLPSGFVAPSLVDVQSTSLGAPAQRSKSLRQNGRWPWAFSPHRSSRLATCQNLWRKTANSGSIGAPAPGPKSRRRNYRQP